MAPAQVLAAIRELKGYQQASAVGYRFVVHHGRVMVDSAVSRGEDSLLGPEVMDMPPRRANSKKTARTWMPSTFNNSNKNDSSSKSAKDFDLFESNPPTSGSSRSSSSGDRSG